MKDNILTWQRNEVPITKYNLTAVYNNTYTKVLHRSLTQKKIEKISHQFDSVLVASDIKEDHNITTKEDIDELLSRLNMASPSEKMKDENVESR